MSTPQPLDDYLLELLQPVTPADTGKAAPAAARPQAEESVEHGTATDARSEQATDIEPPAPATMAADASAAETGGQSEALTDGDAAPAAAPADATAPPSEASTASSGLPAAPPPVAEAVPATPPGKANELITEDEFEALLDQLHGPVKHDANPPPASTATAASGPVPASASATAAVSPAPATPATAPAPSPMPTAPMPVRTAAPRAVPADLFSPPPPMSRRAEERRTRWLLMRCAGQDYAVELLKVQEVVLPTTLLPLRGAAPSMLGVMNLRGQVVPVIDLSTYLHRPVQEDDAATRFVVLEEHGEPLGLRVSAVAEVVDISIRQIETSEHIQTGRTATGLFHGVARIGKSTVILLDASILMQ